GASPRRSAPARASSFRGARCTAWRTRARASCGSWASSIRRAARPCATTRDARRAASLLFGQELRLCLSLRIERSLVAVRPRGARDVARDVPVGAAALQDGAEVEAQLLDGRTAEEPVAVVDLVDAQARLEHERVRNHGVVRGIGVLRDVEVL